MSGAGRCWAWAAVQHGYHDPSQFYMVVLRTTIQGLNCAAMFSLILSR
jgi:hypothetical protein